MPRLPTSPTAAASPPPAGSTTTVVAGRHRHLDLDGIARVGERVPNGGVLVNKQMPKNTNETVANPYALGDDAYRPAALSYKGPVPNYVDQVADACFSTRPRFDFVLTHHTHIHRCFQVLLTSNDADHFLLKIRMRSLRRPELGDKFSSRHGQKGVTGMIVHGEDFPFNDQGVCPDMIMNPHGFPSRMTIGKLIEFIAGKAGVMQGQLKYGTAFGGDRVEDVSRVLVQHGFSYSGKVRLSIAFISV